jgi:hypothetical protein
VSDAGDNCFAQPVGAEPTIASATSRSPDVPDAGECSAPNVIADVVSTAQHEWQRFGR